jgi:hypothetical protein
MHLSFSIRATFLVFSARTLFGQEQQFMPFPPVLLPRPYWAQISSSAPYSRKSPVFVIAILYGPRTRTTNVPSKIRTCTTLFSM